jgi:hypothetical protein
VCVCVCVCVYVCRCLSRRMARGWEGEGGSSLHTERQNVNTARALAAKPVGGLRAVRLRRVRQAGRQAGTGSLHSRGPLWPWGPRRWGSAHDTNGGDSRLRVNEDYGLGED